MGPGFFPVALSAALVCLGAAIAAVGMFGDIASSFGTVRWRAVIMLTLATTAFAAFVDDLGLLAGVFVVSLLATLASPDGTWLHRLTVSAGIAVFCTMVFA